MLELPQFEPKAIIVSYSGPSTRVQLVGPVRHPVDVPATQGAFRAAALLDEVPGGFQGLAVDPGRFLEKPFPEIPRRQGVFLVVDVERDGGSVFREGRAALQGEPASLPGYFRDRVRIERQDGTVPADHDRFQFLAAHDRPDAAPPRGALVVHHGGELDEILAGRPDGKDLRLSFRFPQEFLRFEYPPAPQAGRRLQHGLPFLHQQVAGLGGGAGDHDAVEPGLLQLGPPISAAMTARGDSGQRGLRGDVEERRQHTGPGVRSRRQNHRIFRGQRVDPRGRQLHQQPDPDASPPDEILQYADVRRLRPRHPRGEIHPQHLPGVATVVHKPLSFIGDAEPRENRS